MLKIGYTLSSEELRPRELVGHGAAAEGRGFDFLSISDHYHPWTQSQGHSPFVWSVLGALAQSTSTIELAVGVTCPIMRIHPAVLAQATATTALLCGDRFTFGVGTGEALNEHITGLRWPPPEVRREMLAEAVAIIRSLWTGETVDHHGCHFTVENARLFDPPERPPPVVVSGFGPAAVELAAEIGDGYWGHSPEAETIDRYRESGGGGPLFAQVNVCWSAKTDDARRLAHRLWPNAAIPGQLSQDLPTWTHFEQAAGMVRPEDVASSIPCGPDPEPVIETISAYADAGYDHVYLHQIGPDQDGFLAFWSDHLEPALRQRRSAGSPTGSVPATASGTGPATGSATGSARTSNLPSAPQP
ncbi:MAG: TIGR03557 family F420-dependent LLM class oxidoreductase [Acidimicrobiales bacterium]